MKWGELPAFIADKVVVAEQADVEKNGTVKLTFACGCSVVVSSEYDDGYSEITPGAGIEPPTVEATHCGLHEERS